MTTQRGQSPVGVERGRLLPPLPAELGPTNGHVDHLDVGSTRTNGWLRSGVPDERPIEILEQRRPRAGAIPDRGWLVRRALLVADVVGLLLAFLTVQLVFGNSIYLGDRYNTLEEFGLFLATIPFWVVAAKLHGLYDRDEERADGTTADDLIGVLHVLTIGTKKRWGSWPDTRPAVPAMFWTAFCELISTSAEARYRASCCNE